MAYLRWRFDGNNLYAYELDEVGYQLREARLTLPRLPLNRVEQLARQVGHVRELPLIREFRAWMRATTES